MRGLLSTDVVPERFLGFPNLVPLERGVAVCAQEQHDRARGRDLHPAPLPIQAGDEQRRRAGHRNHKSDIRKECPVIVHYFGERKERRRQKRDQKPKQTETDQARFLENGGRDRNGDEKNAECETCPEARVVCGGERIEVVVGGESVGQKNVLK